MSNQLQADTFLYEVTEGENGRYMISLDMNGDGELDESFTQGFLAELLEDPDVQKSENFPMLERALGIVSGFNDAIPADEFVYDDADNDAQVIPYIVEQQGDEYIALFDLNNDGDYEAAANRKSLETAIGNFESNGFEGDEAYLNAYKSALSSVNAWNESLQQPSQEATSDNGVAPIPVGSGSVETFAPK